MPLIIENTIIEAMQVWYETVLGQRILAAEQARVKEILSDKFGYYLIEFAGNKIDCFAHLSPIAHKFSAMPIETSVLGSTDKILFAELNYFPFLPDSLDCVILPHILEFCACPEQVLQEAWNVLRPNGYLLILAFNPYSLMGVYKKFSRERIVPYSGVYYSYRKLVSMLEAQNFHIDEFANCSFDIPFVKQEAMKKQKIWLALAQLAWPSSANVNIILARKQLGGIIPLKINWDAKATTKVNKVGSLT